MKVLITGGGDNHSCAEAFVAGDAIAMMSQVAEAVLRRRQSAGLRV